MPENKDTLGLAVSHGPEQVKLPVGQVDLSRFFLFIPPPPPREAQIWVKQYLA